MAMIDTSLSSKPSFENDEIISNGILKITIDGTPTQTQYDVYTGSTSNPASMYFHRKGINKITIESLLDTGYLIVDSIKLYVGDIPFAWSFDPYFQFTIGSTATSSTYPIKAEISISEGAVDFDKFGTDFSSSRLIDVPVNGITKPMYFNEKVSFETAGDKEIYAEVLYRVSPTSNDYTDQRKDTTYIGKVQYLNPFLYNIFVVTGNAKTQFELNEEFNYDNLQVKGSYKHSVSGFWSSDNDITSYKISQPNMATEGTQTVTVSYGGFTDTYQIEIGATLSKTLDVDFSSINDTYLITTTLDISNIKATFTLDTKIPSDEDIYPIVSNLTSENLTFRLNSSTSMQLINVGESVLEASYTYEGITYSKSKNISVQDSSVTNLSIISNPIKSLTSYIEEQPLDLKGLILGIEYDVLSFNEAEVKHTDDRIEYILGSETITSNKTLTLGDSGKTLKAKIKETNFEVEIGTISVESIKLSNISVIKTPNKTTYTYGDTFDLKGIAVHAEFNNGTKWELYENSITSSYVGHTFDEKDFSENNTTKAIDISYTHNNITKSDTFDITCEFPKFKTLVLNTDETIKNFKDLSVFTSEGIKVSIEYENGYIKEITDYEIDASVLNLDEENKIHCTNDYGSKIITVKAVEPYTSLTVSNTYIVDIKSSSAIKQAYLKFNEEDLIYKVGDKFDAHGIEFWLQNIDGKEFPTQDFTTSIAIGTVFRSAKVYEIEFTYIQDEFIKPQTLKFRVHIENKISLNDRANYKIAIGTVKGTLFENIKGEEVDISLGLQADGSYIYPIFKEEYVTVDNDRNHDDTYGYNVYTGDNADNDCIGYMDLGLQDEFGNLIRNAHVIFFKDVSNPIEGDGNILVTFPHYINGQADKINNCQFGKVYNNRLFVSGNPNYKNCDWHSEEINVAQIDEYNQDSTKDFTYFSDLDYCYYGSDETAIVGYDIYRDGELVVIKESSKNEATLFKRIASNINATDYTGNILYEGGLTEDAYPCFDINSNGGEGSFTPRSIINFVGDTLFLTRSGLKVLTSNEQASNNAKYTSDVSSLINKKITNEELKKAILFSFKERLFLKTNKGVYVAEYNLRNAMNEYEWYFLDLNVRLFFEIDGELYFADNEGNINKFATSSASYVDKKRTFVNKGGALLTGAVDDDGFSIDEENNAILVSKDYANDIVEGRDFHLITTYTENKVDKNCLIHASLGKFIHEYERANNLNKPTYNHSDYIGIIKTENNTIVIHPYKDNNNRDDKKFYECVDLFYDGRKVYIDQLQGYPLPVTIDEEYTLSKADKENPFDYSYHILDKYGNIIELNSITTMRLSFIVNELQNAKITQVVENDDDSKLFKIVGDHNKVLDLIYYNNRNDRYSGIITNKQNVVAYYKTKPFNFGTSVYEKIIHSWVLINDSGLPSSVEVGYVSSRKQKGEYSISSDNANFSNNNFSFARIQFTDNNLPHVYVRNRTVPNVNYIEFIFKNDEDLNMVLSQLSLIYSISQTTRGVK